MGTVFGTMFFRTHFPRREAFFLNQDCEEFAPLERRFVIDFAALINAD